MKQHMISKFQKVAVLLLAGAIFLQPLTANAEDISAEQMTKTQKEVFQWFSKDNEDDFYRTKVLLEVAGTATGDWFAFAAARAGVTEGKEVYLAALKMQIEKLYQDEKSSVSSMPVSDMDRVILTIDALGGDPENFGADKDGNTINLVEDVFNDCLWDDIGEQGTNGYLWTLIAMDASDYPDGGENGWNREQLKEAILARQNEDGGFPLVEGDDSDPDITAMVLTALAEYRLEDAVAEAGENAFSYLSGCQDDQGGIESFGVTNEESTGWVIIALCSWDKDPVTDQQFIKNNKSLMDYFLGCQTQEGGFVHSGEDTEASNIPSYEAVYTLEAVKRYISGENTLFDLSDATNLVLSQEVTAAKEEAVKILNQSETTNQKKISEINVKMIAIIAAVIVLVIVALAFALMKKKKPVRRESDEYGKQKNDDFDDDDDEW